MAARALFTFHSQAGNFAEFERIGWAAILHAPNNPDLLADFGNKLALDMGKWDAGVALVRRAISLNHKPPGGYYVSLAFDAYRRGNCVSAIEYSNKFNTASSVLYQLIRLACFQQLDDVQHLRMQISEARNIGYIRFSDIVDRIEMFSIYFDLITILNQDVSMGYSSILN